MTDQHPAVTFLLAAHGRAEVAAKALPRGPWRWVVHHDAGIWEGLEGPDGVVLAASDSEEYAARIEKDDGFDAYLPLIQPEVLLARVEAEREILAEHAPGDMARERDETECRTCSEPQLGFSGMWAAEFPCRTVLLLAKAWGWEAGT